MNNFLTQKKYVVIAVVVLLIALIGFLMFKARADLSPNVVASRFYQSVIDANKNAPPTALERKLHLKSTYVTSAFGKSVERAAAEGRDGMLCLGAVPTTFTLDGAAIATNGEYAAIHFNADAAAGRILLTKDSRGWWRIDETDCEVDISRKNTPPTRFVATSTATTTLSL